MFRRIASTIALACCLSAIAMPSAQARPADARIVVAIVEEPLVHGWAGTGLRSLLDDGASALLSTRTGESSGRPDAEGEAAIRSIGAGGRVSATGDGTSLGAALGRQGVTFAVDPSFLPDLSGRRVRAAGIPFPGATTSPSVSIESLTSMSSGAAAARLDALSRTMQRRDELIVLSLSRSLSDVYERIYLDAISIVGPQVPAGLLYSPTTHRAGVVSITDIAPTILDQLGLDVPSEMSGRPIEFRPRRDAVAALLPLERDVRRAARVRSLLVRVFMTAIMVIVGLVGLVLAIGKTPRRIAWVLPPMVAIPLAMLLFPLLPGARQPVEVAEIAALAIALGAAASFVARTPSRAIALTGGVTAFVVLGDVLLGSPLGSRSPISFLIAGGARFYGIGNELMGVVIGGALVAVAVTFGVRDRSTAVTRALLLAAAVAIMAAPGIGAKFGATLTAVPAFGVIAARAGGRRVGLRTGASIAGLSVLSAGAVYLADRLRAPAARSHIGAIGSAGDRGVLSRKLSAAKALITFSIWMKVLLVFAVVLLVLWWRRRDDLRLAVFARAGLGAALQAGAVGIVCALLFNDAGAIAAAFIAVPLIAMTLCALIEPVIPEGVPESELRAARAV